ncbi:sodium:solute symporter [Bacteroidales bacterium OttesenSCG-928-K03]|nr:sodium:solute symporter [Odoribacter sp. OttesenSCG-928-L07]MDL2242688.1 sodium:solute symporter [Bacteroidales bacterium OttesenSCG-928-K03]
MDSGLILICFIAYTALIFVIAFVTSRKAKNDSYFIGERKSSWPIVAYGMIGASLSGVTFISIPGDVYHSGFSYMMVVFGYLLGYAIIATVLLPVYYKLKLTTIYTYLQQRFGNISYRTGSTFFIISKLLGAAGRLFLVAYVLQKFVFDAWNVPFAVTATIFVGLIVLYTFKGGIKTIIWTDTLQTTFMILALIICFFMITKSLNIGFSGMIAKIFEHDYSKMIVTDWNSRLHYLKQFFGGAFIAVTMTGLDQDMMQKNLSCKDLKSAQKNMFMMSSCLIPVNFLFLLLGVALYIFAESQGIAIPAQTDELFPLIMLKYLGPVAGIVFMIGLISAAYSSGDGALTALTTSFCIDFLGFDDKRKELSEEKKKNIRIKVHFSFAIIMILLILAFNKLNDNSVITTIFMIAGYTYGPLLGLFALGLFTKLQLKDKYVPFVAIIAPIICYFLNMIFPFGFALIIVNGAITFLGLLIISKKKIG